MKLERLPQVLNFQEVYSSVKKKRYNPCPLLTKTCIHNPPVIDACCKLFDHIQYLWPNQICINHANNHHLLPLTLFNYYRASTHSEIDSIVSSR